MGSPSTGATLTKQTGNTSVSLHDELAVQCIPPHFRGDWDFCSPFPGDSCQWSAWGSWGGCSATCGPGSRTRRRRIEAGTSGRVGDCSGETEVAFQACNFQPCAGRSDEKSTIRVISVVDDVYLHLSCRMINLCIYLHLRCNVCNTLSVM